MKIIRCVLFIVDGNRQRLFSCMVQQSDSKRCACSDCRRSNQEHVTSKATVLRQSPLCHRPTPRPKVWYDLFCTIRRLCQKQHDTCRYGAGAGQLAPKTVFQLQPCSSSLLVSKRLDRNHTSAVRKLYVWWHSRQRGSIYSGKHGYMAFLILAIWA